MAAARGQLNAMIRVDYWADCFFFAFYLQSRKASDAARTMIR